MKPYLHAKSSVKRFGGSTEDYIDIHNFMDSSKGAIGDCRHRALTHTTWFLSNVLERVFGLNITLANGKEVSVRDVGEQHILEDFGGKYIPTPQDFLANMPIEPWMVNGREGCPHSSSKLMKPVEPQEKLSKVQSVFENAEAATAKLEKEVFFDASKQ